MRNPRNLVYRHTTQIIVLLAIAIGVSAPLVLVFWAMTRP